MYQPNLSNPATRKKRQEKFMAWLLTLLLHLLVIGGGVFWYLQQPKNSMAKETAIVSPTQSPAAVTPASTTLQAEIDPTAPLPVATAATPSQSLEQAASQSTHSPARQASPNGAKVPPTPKPISPIPPPSQPEVNPTIPLHTDVTKNEFPINNSTITQTDTKTTPTAHGTMTITTTNRITTVAPEVDQAMTQRDIPAKERQTSMAQTRKHLSATAKEAEKISKQVEQDNNASTELIEAVKRRNHTNIAKDSEPTQNK